MSVDTNTEVQAIAVKLGDLIYDPIKSGTHGQRVVVEWRGHHGVRRRSYIAGVEESSRNPVTLAYDDADKVKVFRS